MSNISKYSSSQGFALTWELQAAGSTTWAQSSVALDPILSFCEGFLSWKRGCPRVKTFGRTERWWSKGVNCQVLYLSEYFYIRKVIRAFYELTFVLSGCGWSRLEPGGAQEILELAGGCTAPAQWPLVIGQPEVGQENCWSPTSNGQAQAGESCSLWSNWGIVVGWIPPPHQTSTWTSMHPAFQMKDT